MTPAELSVLPGQAVVRVAVATTVTGIFAQLRQAGEIPSHTARHPI